MNEVTQEQAAKLDQKIRSLKLSLNDLTLSELKQVRTFAQQLGLVDMYNSTPAFVQEEMAPVNTGDHSTSDLPRLSRVCGHSRALRGDFHP